MYSFYISLWKDKDYRLRDAIVKSQSLGRPLTEKKMQEYEIDDKEMSIFDIYFLCKTHKFQKFFDI